MTHDELTKRSVKMFGRRWKVQLAKELEVHLSAVYRWLPIGDKPPQRPVPKYVDMWFELREQRKKLERFARSLTR